MSSRRLRLLATFAGTAWLLSLTVAPGFAAGPPPIDVNVADRDIGVSYGNITENTNVFDLVLNLNPPDNKTIVSSDKHDDDGDIIWQGPTKTTISDPPKREKHTWTGAGVLANLQHQVRFHGTLASVVGGGGGGGGKLPNFNVGVVDLDIDADCTGASTAAHSPPTGSLAEDKKEDEPLGGLWIENGMIERLNPNDHNFPDNIPPAQLDLLPYKILHVKCVPKWHKSDPEIGFLHFHPAVGVELYQIDNGNKVTIFDSLPVPANTGIDMTFAIVTNNRLTSDRIRAWFQWYATHQGAYAEDIVRIQADPVVIEADVVDEAPSGATYASGIKQGSLVLRLNDIVVSPTVTNITNGVHIRYKPVPGELASGLNRVKVIVKDNACNEIENVVSTWNFIRN